jgi:hypothetical protein
LKEQILSARLRETPYLNVSCTDAEDLPCSLGDTMSSALYTSPNQTFEILAGAKNGRKFLVREIKMVDVHQPI